MEVRVATVIGAAPSSIPFDFEDRCTTGTISTTPIPYHTAFVEMPALSAVMLKSRDPAILTQIGGMFDNKKFSQSSLPQEPFNVPSFVGGAEGETIAYSVPDSPEETISIRG